MILSKYYANERMAKSVDNIFNLILLDELLGNSVVLAISMYYVITVCIIIIKFFIIIIK